MILPIYVYGHEALRNETDPVQENTEALQELIDNMIETMHNAAGIGLAAPQVGRTERLFVVDLTPMADEIAEAGEPLPPQPMVFINPEIVEESEDTAEMEEGCLSIPEVREAVARPERIRMRYRDREFEEQELEAGACCLGFCNTSATISTASSSPTTSAASASGCSVAPCVKW